MGPVLGAVITLLLTSPSPAQSSRDPGTPPGRLVDIGGYRMHLLCAGTRQAGQAAVVLSAGGGDFAVDWTRVVNAISDSARVCSYDRPGYGWSDPGPYPRTFKQEAFELRAALANAGEPPPYVLVGHSLGAFVVRQYAEAYRGEVGGLVLVGAANENGKLGYRGKFMLPREAATDRAIPAPHGLAAAPPEMYPANECDSLQARAERNARIVRPYDQLTAMAQRYRVWLLSHPLCVKPQDDYFAEAMAESYRAWNGNPHPLGDLPLVVVMGTLKTPPPPGLPEAEWRSDTLRIDLSKLSSRGRLVTDSLSGHHIQLDNPRLVIGAILEVLRQVHQ